MTTIHDPVAPLSIVSVNDKAIDWDATDLQKYQETRDLELLKPKGDSKPTKFYIRRLPATFVLQALEGASVGEKTVLALRAALFRVELPTGAELKPSKTTKQLACEVADEEWVNDLSRKFGLSTLYELAAVAIRLASLPEDQRGPFA